MKSLNLATTATVAILVATGLIATVLIALVTGLPVANNQRDTALASCERGNATREDNFASKIADARDLHALAGQVNDRELAEAIDAVADRREAEAQEIVDATAENGKPISPGSVVVRC